MGASRSNSKLRRVGIINASTSDIMTGQQHAGGWSTNSSVPDTSYISARLNGEGRIASITGHGGGD